MIMGTENLRQPTEVKPEVVFLNKLLERITAGRMLVPRFQRPFVWRHEDMIALLDSVLKGFPIGSFLVWETSSTVTTLKTIGPIPVEKVGEGPVAYILDGHQRIATLFGTLMLADDLPKIEHGVDWRIYCDLEKMEFTHEPSDGLKPHLFPVRMLLSTEGYLGACRTIVESVTDSKRRSDLLRKADSLANAFRNFQVPLVSVSEGDMDTAVTVFSRLNRRGRKMSPDQMVSALTYREDEFDLTSKLDELLEGISVKGFGGLDRIFPLRVVLAAMDRDIYARDFADLLVKPELRAELPEAVDGAQRNIDLAIERFTSWGVTSHRLLPYGLQLVFLADFFRKCPNPPSEVEALLARWFWVTSFTGWFGGVNSTQAKLALAEMHELASGKLDAFKTIDLTKPAKPFPSRFDTRSARVRTFMLFLASLQPRSLESEKVLDAGDLLTVYGPRALVSIVNRGLPKELQSSPANRVVLDHEGRSSRGQAISRLRQLEPEVLARVLTSHGFPDSARAEIMADDRASLIQSRLRNLIDGERRFMQARGVCLPMLEMAEPIADSDTSMED